jgi:hypothetical protein
MMPRKFDRTALGRGRRCAPARTVASLRIPGSPPKCTTIRVTTFGSGVEPFRKSLRYNWSDFGRFLGSRNDVTGKLANRGPRCPPERIWQKQPCPPVQRIQEGTQSYPSPQASVTMNESPNR